MLSSLEALITWARHWKRQWDQNFEHPVTRRRLTPEEIERHRQELLLNPDQVERLRQGLFIQLTGEQHIRLHERMCQAGRAADGLGAPPPVKVDTPYGPTYCWQGEAPDSPEVLERARRQAEAEEAESRRRCREYYAAVSRAKWRGIPEDMRAGLRVDRWGTVFEKNPHGQGWRELGSEDDYDILPNSSW